MSLSRVRSKNHYRWIVRADNGTIITSAKWSPKHAFPCEYYTCDECPLDEENCILKTNES